MRHLGNQNRALGQVGRQNWIYSLILGGILIIAAPSGHRGSQSLPSGWQSPPLAKNVNNLSQNPSASAPLLIVQITATKAESTEVKIEAVSAVAVRSGPGSKYPIIGEIKAGGKIVLSGISRDRYWGYFLYWGKPAWLTTDSQHIKIVSGRLDKLAVVTPVVESKTSTPRAISKPRATSVPLSPACNCNGPDLDCSDFTTPEAAQACFNYCWQQTGSDIFKLDGDGDKRVCERR